VTEEGKASSAIEALFRRHSGWLMRALSFRFTPAVAEDLVQEAYLRIAPYQAAGEIRHPKALLLQIATNLANDEFRKARRMAPGGVDNQDGGPSHFLTAASDQYEAVLLKDVVLSMPQLFRDVFVLSRFQGLSYEEIADRCGVSIKTVEWRMSKALAHCKTLMRD
jgi:RNA polymerase sigma factor (sigma-70 family)